MRNVNAVFVVGGILGACLAGPAAGQEPSESTARVQEMQVDLDSLHHFHVTTSGRIIEDTPPQRSASGNCSNVESHTDADFTGGSFVAQGGFAEMEIAAASYTIDPGAFPIRIDLMEMIFATSGAAVQTTTEWSVLVWEGTPATGDIVAQFSSDDIILPHIVLQPGTSGVNVAVSVDPGDPDQIVVQDDGSATFTIGYRIDMHNNQTQDPCFFAPPSSSNAFPTTDVGGLASPTQNWLMGLNCGILGCPANGGWATFQQLPVLCTPSGDWVMRATWSSFDCVPQETGACCDMAGVCLDDVTLESCETGGGLYQGNDLMCPDVSCEQACCFEPSGCVNLIPGDCDVAGGTAAGAGSDCDAPDFVCFPSGACCNPDGSCSEDVAEADCGMGGGVFQGADSVCGGVSCPQPEGACCLSNRNCLSLPEADCMEIPLAGWAGALTNCDDGDMSGTADACEGDGCFLLSDCADSSGDGIRDDACLWYECRDPLCLPLPRTTQADMGGGNGACPIDGACDGNDRFHALNCFSNSATSGGGTYPCEDNPPAAMNIDAGGPGVSCTLDGVCDGNDAFHALNCFSNIDSSGSPPYPCGCSGPQPQAPDAGPLTSATATGLVLRATRYARPGSTVDVDVYFDGPLEALRGYQLHARVSGGRRGTLELVDMTVDARRADYAFAKVAAPWTAFNIDSAQLVVGMDTAEGVPVAAGAYLATLTYRVPRHASGGFVVDVHYDPTARSADERTFVFGAHARLLALDAVQPAVIDVQRRGSKR